MSGAGSRSSSEAAQQVDWCDAEHAATAAALSAATASSSASDPFADPYVYVDRVSTEGRVALLEQQMTMLVERAMDPQRLITQYMRGGAGSAADPSSADLRQQVKQLTKLMEKAHVRLAVMESALQALGLPVTDLDAEDAKQTQDKSVSTPSAVRFQPPSASSSSSSSAIPPPKRRHQRSLSPPLDYLRQQPMPSLSPVSSPRSPPRLSSLPPATLDSRSNSNKTEMSARFVIPPRPKSQQSKVSEKDHLAVENAVWSQQILHGRVTVLCGPAGWRQVDAGRVLDQPTPRGSSVAAGPLV